MMRLTDTDKWKSHWFRSLPLKEKLLYLYILDNCDNAGVMEFDLELISLSLKEDFCLESLKKHFEEKILFLSDHKIVVRRFVAHQHNNNNERMKKNIMQCLSRHGLVAQYDRGDFN